MLRGLYSAASGMLSAINTQEVITNNLANSETIGFKKDIPIYKSFSTLLEREMNQDTRQTKMEATFVDLTQGQLISTENNLNFALEGEGFFALLTPQGVAYTRDGNFSLDNKGKLVNADGFYLLGEKGPISLTSDGIVNDLKFNKKGEMIVNGKVINQIRIDNPSLLSKQGNNLFKAYNSTKIKKTKETFIKEGYLEASNVNIIEEMVNLIENFRLYEANQKVIQSEDNTLNKICNEIGSITK